MKISLVGAIHQKYSQEGVQKVVSTLLDFAVKKGHAIEIESRFYAYLSGLGMQLQSALLMPNTSQISTDLLISMGGDGTFIRASKLIAGTSASILGINTGSLGFLANVHPEEVSDVLLQIENGEVEVEERSLLDAFLLSPEGVATKRSTVLNEVGVLKRDTASMITIDTYIDGDFVASYDCDGLLVATPTGSTAYSLSVGGPILHPASPILGLSPIAPHMLNMRPLVLPETVEIVMEVNSRTGGFALACDGKSTSHSINEKVVVRLSDKKLRLLHPHGHSYFKTLREKLMWGQNVRHHQGVSS